MSLVSGEVAGGGGVTCIGRMDGGLQRLATAFSTCYMDPRRAHRLPAYDTHKHTHTERDIEREGEGARKPQTVRYGGFVSLERPIRRSSPELA